MATQEPQEPQEPQDATTDDDDVYAEVTIACLYCVETGREWLSLGMMKCRHCGGTGKRTIKRRLTPREMTILTRAFEDSGES
jgi:hypothetical protein